MRGSPALPRNWPTRSSSGDAGDAGDRGYPAPVLRRTIRRLRPRQTGERRAADAMRGVNTYSSNLTDAEIAAGKHRQHVSGAWDTIGPLQLDYLVEQGLQPRHRL